MSERTFLPNGRQSIDDDDLAAVLDVLRSDYLTTGPAVERFEAALGDLGLVGRVRRAAACLIDTKHTETKNYPP